METTEVNFNWYNILGCPEGATEETISSSARKMCLKYHPDRTTDPEAPEKFLLVQKAKDFLLNKEKRKELDDFLKAKSKRKDYEEQKSKSMNESRKKMRDGLEEKINSMKKSNDTKNSAKAPVISKAKVDNLRRDGLERMEAHAEECRMRDLKKAQEYLFNKVAQDTAVDGLSQVKIKWKRTRQSHSDESLFQMMKVYGEIESVKIVEGKGNSGLVTFSDDESARKAVRAFDLSDEYRVTIVMDGPSVHSRSRAAIFTHVYSGSSSSPSFTVLSAESDMKTSCGGRGAELEELVRRATEREMLLRQAEEEDRGGGIEITSKKQSSTMASGGGQGLGSAVGGNGGGIAKPSIANESDILRKMMEASVKKRKAGPTIVEHTIFQTPCEVTS